MAFIAHFKTHIEGVASAVFYFHLVLDYKPDRHRTFRNAVISFLKAMAKWTGLPFTRLSMRGMMHINSIHNVT